MSENEPTVVANPHQRKRLVAGTHFVGDTGNRCVAHYSRDGGETWNPIPIHMPQLTHDSTCSDPVLAYAPDGSRVYYVYMDLKTATFDIVVSYSDDDGQTWTGPIVVLTTPPHDYPATCGSTVSGIVVQGSRPQGGLENDVLVAWYHSGTDPWTTGNFQIRTRYSADNGATFGPIVMAATDVNELPFWLGPVLRYHRWWGGMFPDVEIAPNGTGHIVYTHDPVPGTATSEDGDIRYIGSEGPPYAAWSLPTTVNDDASGKAQGWATLEAYSKGERPLVLYAIWEDHRTDPAPNDNERDDVFWATRTGSGTPGPWAPNEKLTDEQSPSDFLFLGDYFDITIARGGDGDGDDPFVYAVWTDRRDEIDEFDFDDDIWGARIPPGDDD